MCHRKDFQKRFKTEKYTGFGATTNNQGDRLVNKDGTSNVNRKGLKFFQALSPFHHLIKISWPKFNFLLISLFTGMNLVFTFTYYFIGLDELQGLIHETPIGKFIEVFTFKHSTAFRHKF